jgi:hypothetical protein
MNRQPTDTMLKPKDCEDIYKTGIIEPKQQSLPKPGEEGFRPNAPERVNARAKAMETDAYKEMKQLNENK